MKSALNYKMQAPVESDVDYAERKDTWKECPELEKIISLLRGNTGIIFTNGDLSDIKGVIDSEQREAPAKPGSIAPCEVWIRAGPTGLDPKQTGFFQNLQIPTKIVKTQIEIVTEKQIIKVGDKIESSHAALLEKLKIRPFSYKMHIKHVYENGAIFSPMILDLTPEELRKKFLVAIGNMASISLACGYVTKPAVPHMLINSFKNLASVSFETDYNFKQADKLKEAAKNAPAAGSAGGAKAEAAPKEAEKEEEEADVDMGGLFGDDY
jgi:large subunit ribosomal protein LP0